jgi:hypothetical protein
MLAITAQVRPAAHGASHVCAHRLRMDHRFFAKNAELRDNNISPFTTMSSDSEKKGASLLSQAM